MRPGQRIELEAHCEKGCGKEHAKWSPAGNIMYSDSTYIPSYVNKFPLFIHLATASYRLMPEIILKEEITGDLADKFASCFAPGVVEIENKNGKYFIQSWF